MSEPGSPLSTRLAKVRALAAERKSKADAARAAQKQLGVSRQPPPAVVVEEEEEDPQEIALREAAIAEGQRIRRLQSSSPVTSPTSAFTAADLRSAVHREVIKPRREALAVGSNETELEALRESEGRLEQQLAITQLELQRDRQALHTTTQQLNEAQNSKRTHVGAVTEVKAQMDAELGALRAQLSQSVSQNQQLERTVDSLKAHTEEEASTVSNLRRELAAAAQQLDETISTGAELITAEHRSAIAATEARHLEQDKRNDEQSRQLKAENEQLKRLLEETERKMVDKADGKPKEPSMPLIERELAGLQQQVKKLERSRQDARDQLAEAREQHADRERQLLASQGPEGHSAASNEQVAAKYREAVQSAVDGKHEHSVDLLLQVVALDPDHKSAHTKLGLMLSDQFGRFVEAEHHFCEVSCPRLLVWPLLVCVIAAIYAGRQSHPFYAGRQDSAAAQGGHSWWSSAAERRSAAEGTAKRGRACI